MININSFVNALRKFRTIHKFVGVGISLFLLVVSATGVLLGWKKNVELLQPRTNTGSSDNLSGWISFEQVSITAMRSVDSLKISKVIDRLDVRPEKGIVKVLMKEGYWEVQVDGKTGQVLSVAQRHADWIEHLHDGSLFSEGFKLAYTNIVGVGLFVLALSGLWLWYGPKVIRKAKHKPE